MAIKLPDPGNGIPEQKTGNDEWTNMQIVRENFADQSNAASRLVGTAAGQIPLAEDALKAAFGRIPTIYPSSEAVDFNTLEGGDMRTVRRDTSTNNPSQVVGQNVTVLTMRIGGMNSFNSRFQFVWGQNQPGFAWRTSRSDSLWQEWEKPYTDGNTTKEEGTGYLVASSPVLKMQHDSFEKVHEAEQLDIEVKNIKTGVYEITGTTGLREGDVWNLKPPKDVNGNVLCICEATESNGVITLKTYKKKFDFETVSIVADYEQPTDIPEGATVMLRFNDLPQEQIDEPAI